MCSQFTGLTFMLCKVSGVLNSTLPVLITLGVVYFVWGVVQYVIGDSEEAKTKGRDRIIFGIIGLAVILVVWGLVYVLLNTFNIGGQAPTREQLNTLLPQ
jgi:hypothetical protein